VPRHKLTCREAVLAHRGQHDAWRVCSGNRMIDKDFPDALARDEGTWHMPCNVICG
jgi:hypothetical protein